MVHRGQPLILLVPLEHREVRDPEQIAPLPLAADLLAESAEHACRDVGLVGDEQKDVTLASLQLCPRFLHL